MRKARNNDHQRRGLIRDNAVIGSLFVKQTQVTEFRWGLESQLQIYIFLRDGVSKNVTSIVSVKIQWFEVNISITYGISLIAGAAQSNYTCLW